MEKKQVLIIGGGLSGLSTAWHLSKICPGVETILLEKTKRVGGWMDGYAKEGFVIESGPRIFKTSRNEDFLEVIEGTGLADLIGPSSPEANIRFLRVKGALHKMPTSPFSLFTSKLCRPLVFSLLKEPFQPRVDQDETIWDFACRRFGKEVAERFFDPLTLGIYAGDLKKLSVKSCFSLLKKWEIEKGGVLRGSISSLFGKKKTKREFPSSSLFSLKGGTNAFLEKWIQKMPCQIEYEQEALSLKKKGKKWEVSSKQKKWEVDALILALPAKEAAELLQEESFEISKLLDSIVYQDVTSIHVGWKGDVLALTGFGYLIPQKEKEPVLGVLFDSKIFPRENGFSQISLLVEGVFHTDLELEKIVRRVCEDHLNIQSPPDFVSWKKMKRAIPQYFVGHEKKVEEVQKLAQKIPGLYITGNYLEGVSVNDCFKTSKELAIKIRGDLFSK